MGRAWLGGRIIQDGLCVRHVVDLFSDFLPRNDLLSIFPLFVSFVIGVLSCGSGDVSYD